MNIMLLHSIGDAVLFLAGFYSVGGLVSEWRPWFIIIIANLLAPRPRGQPCGFRASMTHSFIPRLAPLPNVAKTLYGSQTLAVSDQKIGHDIIGHISFPPASLPNFWKRPLPPDTEARCLILSFNTIHISLVSIIRGIANVELIISNKTIVY